MNARMIGKLLAVGALLVLPTWGTTAEKVATQLPAKPHHWQEGEVVEIEGRLELSGDRAIFYPPEGEPLRVLENLALERVTRVLTESPSDRLWLVSGTITEYRGSHYLLITRAIRRAVNTNPKHERGDSH